MDTNEKLQKTTLYLDKKLYEKIKNQAREERRTITAVLTLAMEQYIGSLTLQPDSPQSPDDEEPLSEA